MPYNPLDLLGGMTGYDQGAANTMGYADYLSMAQPQEPLQPPPTEKPSAMKSLFSNLLAGISGGMQAPTGEIAFAAGQMNAANMEQYYQRLRDEEYKKKQDQQLYEMNVTKNNLERIKAFQDLQEGSVQLRNSLYAPQVSLYQLALNSGGKDVAQFKADDEASATEFINANGPNALGKYTHYQLPDGMIHVVAAPPRYGPDAQPITIDSGDPAHPYRITTANQDVVNVDKMVNEITQGKIDDERMRRQLETQRQYYQTMIDREKQQEKYQNWQMTEKQLPPEKAYQLETLSKRANAIQSTLDKMDENLYTNMALKGKETPEMKGIRQQKQEELKAINAQAMNVLYPPHVDENQHVWAAGKDIGAIGTPIRTDDGTYHALRGVLPNGNLDVDPNPTQGGATIQNTGVAGEVAAGRQIAAKQALGPKIEQAVGIAKTLYEQLPLQTKANIQRGYGAEQQVDAILQMPEVQPYLQDLPLEQVRAQLLEEIKYHPTAYWTAQ